MKSGDSLVYPLPLSLRLRGKQTNGVQVSSTADISVVGLDYDDSYGGDGYLALPTHVLGVKYVVASFQPYSLNARAKIGIISAHDENNISIQPNQNATIKYAGISYNYLNPLQNLLDKLQTVQLTSGSDLSGTIISSSKPTSLTSSVDRVQSGNWGGYDKLGSLLLPVSQWGKHYILTSVGSATKKMGDIFRIFAHEKSTIVETAYWTKVVLGGTYAEIS